MRDLFAHRKRNTMRRYERKFERERERERKCVCVRERESEKVCEKDGIGENDTKI